MERTSQYLACQTCYCSTVNTKKAAKVSISGKVLGGRAIRGAKRSIRRSSRAVAPAIGEGSRRRGRGMIEVY